VLQIVLLLFGKEYIRNGFNMDKVKNEIPLLAPMLAPNKLLVMDIELENKHLPMLASTKYNGIRAILINGVFYSRTGNIIYPPQSMREKLLPLIDWAEKNAVVLDGEMNSNSYNRVGETMSIMAGTIPLPEDFKYKVFYVIPKRVWMNPFFATMDNLIAQNNFLPPTSRSEVVRQIPISTKEEFDTMVENGQFSGVEGIMLLSPTSHYKHGRVTEKEGTFLKYKYYGDNEDAQIVDITYRKEKRSDVIVKTSPLGYAKGVYQQDAFDDTDIGGALVCKMENGTIIKAPFPLDYPLLARKRAAALFGTGQPGDLKGMWISFKRLLCENKDKPISIKGVEFRDSK